MKLTIEVTLRKTEGPTVDEDEAFDALDTFLDGQEFDVDETVFEVTKVVRAREVVR